MSSSTPSPSWRRWHRLCSDNALFKPLPPAKEEVDPNRLLHYTNVFDAMVDAAYFSWQEPYATRDNGDAYNSNLIRHLLLGRAGTPLRPEPLRAPTFAAGEPSAGGYARGCPRGLRSSSLGAL